MVDDTPDLVGTEPPAVLEFQAKLFAEYAPPPLAGAALNVSVSYTGSSAYDELNTAELDGFLLVGLGARYGLCVGGTPVTLRASVENLFDKKYWLPRDTLIPGTPRTINLSASVDL